MNRTSIARTMLGALAVLAPIAAIRPANAADAPPAPAPAAASDVATIAAGLEASDAATRAKAAEVLGPRYPEAAAAVPVLLDATRDEDAAVRAAAVRALRLLGRRGQEDATKAWTTMSATDLRLHGESFEFLHLLGAAVTPTDLAVVFVTACAEGRDRVRPALLGLPVQPLRPPWLEFTEDVAFEDAIGLIAVAAPWMTSDDAATSRTAAAVVAILGRSAVAGAGPADAATSSAPDLRALLTSTTPVVQFAGYMLLGIGGPHDAATATAILDAVPRIAPADDESQTSWSEPRSFRVRRNHGLFAARSLGAAARPLVLSGEALPEVLDGVLVRYLLDLDARDEVSSRWIRQLADATSPRPELPIDPSVVFGIGRDPTLTKETAWALPGLFDAERRGSAASRALLAPEAAEDPAPSAAPEAAPDDQPSSDANPREVTPCVAIAWLTWKAPAADVGAAERATAERVLSRALATAGRPADARAAAAAIVELNRPGLLPPAKLAASLGSTHFREDGLLATLLLRAAATVGDLPVSITAVAGPLATAAPTPPELSGGDRKTLAAFGPRVRAALELRAGGSRTEVPTLRRLAAIDALGAVTGDKARAKAVLAPLTKDPDARVRYRAAKALRRLGA